MSGGLGSDKRKARGSPEGRGYNDVQNPSLIDTLSSNDQCGPRLTKRDGSQPHFAFCFTPARNSSVVPLHECSPTQECMPLVYDLSCTKLPTVVSPAQPTVRFTSPRLANGVCHAIAMRCDTGPPWLHTSVYGRLLSMLLVFFWFQAHTFAELDESRLREACPCRKQQREWPHVEHRRPRDAPSLH